jgi:hypothetical protein
MEVDAKNFIGFRSARGNWLLTVEMERLQLVGHPVVLWN